MSDGPFKQKLFETEIELRLVPVELDMDAKNATYETTRAELYQWCADIANAAYRELHPPVSEERDLDWFFIPADADDGGAALDLAKRTITLSKANQIVRERILAQGVRVWGPYITYSGIAGWFNKQSDEDTHQGIVINIEDVTK